MTVPTEERKTEVFIMRNETLKKLYNFIKLVLKAVGAAMGVAVVVLSIMGKLDTETAIMMLGIGLAGLGTASIMGKKNED